MKRITSKALLEYLDELFLNPVCELNYDKDYELLIATVLSAQSTDKRVNMVTKELFSKYDIYSLSKLDNNIIEEIIRPVGTFRKKAEYIKEISNSLLINHNGNVPNDRNYLEGLPGVGRKTCNVVLSHLFNEPCIAVDTHVTRVCKRLNITNDDDSPLVIENKLMSFIPKEKWCKIHLQLVLFGRYHCKSLKPNCIDCKLKEYCKKNSSL